MTKNRGSLKVNIGSNNKISAKPIQDTKLVPGKPKL